MAGSVLQAALTADGQEHLFEGWEVAPQSLEEAAGRRRLLEQLSALDAGYPGGLLAYVRRARELLGESQRGANPFAGYTPQVPSAVAFDFSAGDAALREAEDAGAEAFSHCACVLVAGGLGERLGYSGIKLGLPCEISSGTTFLGLYCAYIQALQALHAPGARVPLCIMTSDDTHALTQELLEREAYFGLDQGQVVLMKQAKVASLLDASGRIALKGPFEVLTKPHGHGDVHLLLHQTGLAQQWAAAGRKWVLFFQDTNPCSFRTLPAALGVSVARGLDVNSVAIPRKAKAAAGAIMRLCHDEGHEVTVNVEYNFVDSLLRATVSPDLGDVNAADGYSAFPGNMNQLIFALEPYVEALASTGGIVPEFVNPKYADESRTVFKSPTRLECMMQDYPWTLHESGLNGKVGVTVFRDAEAERSLPEALRSLTHRLYAPAKNNLRVAAANFAKGVPDASTTSTELAVYACNALMLRSLGCNVEGPSACAYGGMPQPEWPHIVLLPSFCPLLSRLAEKLPEPPTAVRISARSTLVVSGRQVSFSGPIDLDGVLVIEAVDGAIVDVQSVRVKTQPWTFESCAHHDGDHAGHGDHDDHHDGNDDHHAGHDDGDDEVHIIRGFRVPPGQRARAHRVIFEQPGTFAVKIHVP